jgi:hypothetical protein
MRLALQGLLVVTCLACGRSSGSQGASPGTDAGPTPVDSGVETGLEASVDAPSCFTNPQTYLEIINACTDAEAVDKTDDLSPMSAADGGLQPLP